MGLVQLILREDVHKLGDAGDLVQVKPGYARNFLLPQGKASLATSARVQELAHEKRIINEKLSKEQSDLEALRGRLEGTELSFTAQAGEEGKLFGSVTAAQVAEQLAEKGLSIDRRKIVLDEPIKSLGEHEVSVRLRRELIAVVKVSVEAAE
jgi:large subunit ribosomal protein L9